MYCSEEQLACLRGAASTRLAEEEREDKDPSLPPSSLGPLQEMSEGPGGEGEDPRGVVVCHQWCERVRKCAYATVTRAGSTVLHCVAVLQCLKRHLVAVNNTCSHTYTNTHMHAHTRAHTHTYTHRGTLWRRREFDQGPCI